MSSLNVNLGSGAPILIPCPIQRSVTFAVRLGECTCAMAHYVEPMAAHQHDPVCPGRPIRVSCSISGKTWEESAIIDCERADGGPLPAQSIMDERWALVKALLLNTAPAEHPLCTAALLSQRTEVFLALSDMARAEEAAVAARDRALDAFPNTISRFAARQSHGVLATYVERLIEQVGVL